jgi:hypothetical protein
MDWWGIALCAVCVVLVCLPPKYDPAIRWKERLEGWPKRGDRS